MVASKEFDGRHAVFSAPEHVRQQIEQNIANGITFCNARLIYSATDNVDITLKFGDKVFPNYDEVMRFCDGANANESKISNVQHVGVKAETSQLGTIFTFLVKGVSFHRK